MTGSHPARRHQPRGGSRAAAGLAAAAAHPPPEGTPSAVRKTRRQIPLQIPLRILFRIVLRLTRSTPPLPSAQAAAPRPPPLIRGLAGTAVQAHERRAGGPRPYRGRPAGPPLACLSPPALARPGPVPGPALDVPARAVPARAHLPARVSRGAVPRVRAARPPARIHNTSPRPAEPARFHDSFRQQYPGHARATSHSTIQQALFHDSFRENPLKSHEKGGCAHWPRER